MIIAILAGASSIHTIRWANGLFSLGHEVHVISQHKPIEPFLAGVKLHSFPFYGGAGYFLMVPAVRVLLKKINPDIVNAHYASGYATTARLVGHKPWVLSVWGSDIYEFPKKSFLHTWLVRKNLNEANAVASTSYAMADEVKKIASNLKKISITPFGINTDNYVECSPLEKKENKNLVIGTVKGMEHIYGIDTLLHSFHILKNKKNDNGCLLYENLRLRLVGGGSQSEYLKRLAVELKVIDYVDFVGRVNNENVPHELEKIDIYVALSRSESFGVAIIEAGAAARPVVVSNVGGLPEVVLDTVTGLIVEKENPEEAAKAIEYLLLNFEERYQMSLNAKEHVFEKYSWNRSLERMIDFYLENINVNKQKG